MNNLFAFGLDSLFQPSHILLLLIIGILFFGKRLPEMGRSLGKGIVEFKKGLRGLEDEVHDTVNTPQAPAPQIEAPRPPQRVAATAPKFEDNAGTISTPPSA